MLIGMRKIKDIFSDFNSNWFLNVIITFQSINWVTLFHTEKKKKKNEGTELLPPVIGISDNGPNIP